MIIQPTIIPPKGKNSPMKTAAINGIRPQIRIAARIAANRK